MDQKQMGAAKAAMLDWLSHPAELGKAPAKLECAGEFDLHALHYYIFKYKKTLFGKWLLGVCGGYEGDALEHCGHVFSEMEEYSPASAQDQAVALVEKLRSYWMAQAEEAERQKEACGSFVHFVLLEEPHWNKAAFLQSLRAKWGIDAAPECAGISAESEDTLVVSCHGVMLAVSLMPTPVPNEEAEGAAEKNFMWPGGVEQVKRHKAHLLVSVIGRDAPAPESGKLLVKAVASACEQDGVLGVYTGPVVLAPDYYLAFSHMLEEDLLPLHDLVWFGLYRGEHGLCGYTEGMRAFGYDEIEVLDTEADAKTLLAFLSDIADYVISSDVVLRGGKTIGFSAEQKLPISRSRGVAVSGDSLKIGF